MEKEPQNNIIIGGGISGLALLHYLKIKHYFDEQWNIQLLEREDCAGGTIQSKPVAGGIFESGPNGFLNNQPQTLKLIEELGLKDQLVESNQHSKTRYITLNNQLHALPQGPKELFKTPLLNPLEKLRLLAEPFIPKGNKEGKESIYAFTQRRFGKKFAEVFADPFVSGIYAGDAKEINLKSAFPQIFELEQTHSSLIRAQIAKRKKHKTRTPTKLFSLNKGMHQVIESLSEKYASQIAYNADVTALSRTNDVFEIYTDNGHYKADKLYLATPAYISAKLLKPLYSDLADNLEKINYAPVAVVGLTFSKNIFNNFPDGFGCLNPSSENKESLGILFENNIFPQKHKENYIFVRVLIGGIRHPNVSEYTQETCIALAHQEIETIFPNAPSPQETIVHLWQKAIPQYDQTHAEIVPCIQEQVSQIKGLHLCANYLNGVSFNDCIKNAYQLACQRN